jgi:hypothetical protein
LIKLASDENFDGDILRGRLRLLPGLDAIRVQDAGLAGSPDPVILAWTADDDRILLTHDRETMPGFAYDRVRAGQLMPGVFLVSDRMAKGLAINQLSLAAQCLETDDCRDLVIHFPL